MKFLSLILALGIIAGPSARQAAAAPEDGGDRVKLPVFMYHRLLRHPSTSDQYTISPEAFECDLKYLSENGYTAVGTRELLDYAELGVSLPSKPVMITFDDGHFNNLHYAEPLLEKYGMKAVIFVVGRYSDLSSRDGIENPNYSYIRWERMENLSSVIEIQNHTWDMHRLNGGRRGIKRRPGESREDYERALRADLGKLNAEIERRTGRAPAAFALPFGAEEEWAYPVLEESGLKICFCSREGIAVIRRGRPESLRNVRRILRRPGRTAEGLLKKFGSDDFSGAPL